MTNRSLECGHPTIDRSAEPATIDCADNLKATRTLEALLLDCTPHGESFLQLVLLSPQKGMLYALMRQSRSKTIPQPDPPQLVEIVLERSRSSGPYFVREWQASADWRVLARDWVAFSSWARILRFLRPHLHHLENPAPPFQLLLRSLNALIPPSDPYAVELKTLFVFGRNEGYPVQQQWLPSLPKGQLTIARSTLFSPLSAASTARAEELQPIITSLKLYLAEVSHLRQDDETVT